MYKGRETSFTYLSTAQPPDYLLDHQKEAIGHICKATTTRLVNRVRIGRRKMYHLAVVDVPVRLDSFEVTLLRFWEEPMS
jgi:hypothetical protein